MDPFDATNTILILSEISYSRKRIHSKAVLTRAIHALVIFTLLIPTIAVPSVSGAAASYSPEPVDELVPEKVEEKVGSTYQAATFSHPEPRMGDRDNDEILPSQISGGQSSIPLLFIENSGQFEENELFRVRGAYGNVHIATDEIWVTILDDPGISIDGENPEGKLIKGNNLRITFPGSNSTPDVEGIIPIESKVSYFYGNDPQEWKIDVPVWGGVRYKNIYPSVDLEIFSEDGVWAWQFVIRELDASSPGQIHRLRAIVAKINLKIAGADEISLDDDRVSISTGFSELRIPLLGLFDANGVNLSREFSPPGLIGDSIDAPFKRGNRGREISAGDLGFSVGNMMSASGKLSFSLDPERLSSQLFPPQVPDLSGQDDLIYSTFLGGSSNDNIWGIDVNVAGEVFIAGGTASSDFPTTPGAFETTFQVGDAFITKLNSDASGLVFSTFIGGSSGEVAYAMAVDASGSTYITGSTVSTDFPTTTGAFDTLHNGSSDTFITKLNSAGDQLVYSTFFGGSLGDIGRSVAINGQGEAFIAGITGSSDLPTSPTAVQTAYVGSGDAFVARMSAAGDNFIYSTYLGGSDGENIPDIAIDDLDSAYIAGRTSSIDFPSTVGAYQTACNSCPSYDDLFISKLLPDGSDFGYSTFLEE